MKHLFILFSFFSLVFLSSCETTEVISNKINTDSPLENKFVLKNDQKKKISKQDLIASIIKDADLPENTEFSDIILKKLTSEEKGEQNIGQNLYSLSLKANNGLVSITQIFSADQEDNYLIKNGSTCKCTSTGCSNGCDADIWGGNCRCSYCSSECKKESTVTTSE